MWWPFRSKQKETPPPPPDSGDWSLRANGETYYDQNNETDILLNRLKRSTASVTGIAGQRGAGKSSLALRVLGESEKLGAFTLLIHSPTGYDAREFLIAVFQRICEEVKSQLNQRFGQADSLSDRGHAVGNRLRVTVRSIWLGIAFVSFTTVGYVTYRFSQEWADIRLADVSGRQAELNAREAKLQNNWDALTEKQSLTEVEQTMLTEISSELEYVREERSELKGRYERSRDVLSSSTLVFAPLMILTYAVAFCGFRVVQRLRRRIELAEKFPAEMGLQTLATDLLEHLQYQTTLTASSEAGLGIAKATAKLTRAKELESRPLSLPGLTAELAAFLEHISEVYSGRVVICLDELDKVEQPEELDELLRGIKGLLGQRHTHFLLTVSEDAMTRFSTRRRMDRGMLESAFEDIIFLERVGLSAATHMLNLMYPEEDRVQLSDEVHPSSILLWLFGNGIPREIKRNALSLLDTGQIPRNMDTLELWRSLFKSRIEAVRSWASRIGDDDQTTSHFLNMLEDTKRSFDRTPAGQETYEAWYIDTVAVWRASLDDLINCGGAATGVEPEALAGVPALSLRLARALLELMIGASGIRLATGPRNTHPLDQQLSSVFESIPTNAHFAARLCLEYIDDLNAPVTHADTAASKSDSDSGGGDVHERAEHTSPEHTAIVDCVGLPRRIRKALAENGVESSDHLSSLSDDELEQMKGIGKRSVEEIRGWLSTLGDPDQSQERDH